MIEGRVNANGEATINLILYGYVGGEKLSLFVKDTPKPNRLWAESVLVNILHKSRSMSCA